MPRELLKRLTPHPTTLQKRWYVRVFGARLTDPRLWAPQRRCVTAAFSYGLAICFVPLPIHLPLAAVVAILSRVNLPTLMATVCLTNPLTVVPVFYTAYRVGCAVLGREPQVFAFKLSFDWVQNGLGPMWQPFLLGCVICGILAALAGRLGLELMWRTRVLSKYRARRAASTT